MKIVIYGLTITSSWGNGHASTFRSLVRALHRRGHHIDFVEKDVEWYRSNRDLPEPDFCSVRLYDQWTEDAEHLIRLSQDADAIVIGSYFPDAIAATRALLEQGYGPIFFYDIDTPVTLAELRKNGQTGFLDTSLIPCYTAYLSFTGGPALRELETHFGAQSAVPFYCSVDPDIYRPVEQRRDFLCDLSYLGTYAVDRQPSLERLLLESAALLPESRFLVAGPQYPDGVRWGNNVDRITHLAPAQHPAFYSSSRFTLNLTRADMIQAGYSPSVRLFEASACGTAIISDSWLGLEEFLTPGQEILLPRDAREVCEMLTSLPAADRVRMGERARERILAEHSSTQRARQFESVVTSCYSGTT